jgi:hypothetical protein
MTEKSMLWATPTSGDGATGYTEDETRRLFRTIVQGLSSDTEGIFPLYDGHLMVSGTTSPLSVLPGRAMVNGLFYWNTASVSVPVPTPVLGTTGHRVVLRANYAARTVRITLLSSDDGVAVVPDPVQIEGTTWDLSLCTLTITTGGVMTKTDTRQFLHFATKVKGDEIDDDSINESKLRAAPPRSVLGNPPDSVGTPQWIAAPGGWETLLAYSGGVIQFIQLSSGLIPNDIVDDTKVGNRVAQFYRRKGGSATDWNTPGSTTYTPGAVRMQAGVVADTPDLNPDSGSIAITFPVAYSAKPIIQLSRADGNAFPIFMTAENITSAGFTLRWYATNVASAGPINFHWLAIGPE